MRLQIKISNVPPLRTTCMLLCVVSVNVQQPRPLFHGVGKSADDRDG